MTMNIFFLISWRLNENQAEYMHLWDYINRDGKLFREGNAKGEMGSIWQAMVRDHQRWQKKYPA